jgi:hypothetical protein
VSAQQSAGPATAIASLPFPLPTYATDVLLGGICIFRRQRVSAIELLNIGLVVLWRELRLLWPLPKSITPGDEFLQLLWGVTTAVLRRSRAHGYKGAAGTRCSVGLCQHCRTSAVKVGKEGRLKQF